MKSIFVYILRGHQIGLEVTMVHEGRQDVGLVSHEGDAMK